MNVSVVGEGHLAAATSVGCGAWFPLTYVHNADLVWFCTDTPVDENDEPNVASVMDLLRQTLAATPPTVPVLISSQVPVGFCARAEAEFPEHHLASQPENIRKNHALEDFLSQTRMIVGTRFFEDRHIITKVLSHFTPEILWMLPESAEMTKHALNAFLATEIVFANEIAEIAKTVGADVDDVFRGFLSDHRVGSGPLHPGGPYRGGTLGRDVVVLSQHNPGPLLSAIKPSNDRFL